MYPRIIFCDLNMTSGKIELPTPITAMFDIRYPIVLAGMAGGLTTPQLVAEVSNAGGLGILGAARLSPEQTGQQVRAIKSMTDKPFGVNFLIAPPEPYKNQDIKTVQQTLNNFRKEMQIPKSSLENAMTTLPPSQLSEQLRVVFEEKVPILSFGLGDPSKWVSEAHASGMKIMTMITTVEEAQRVADIGVDVIVAQGAEAGGHRSTFKLPENGEVPLVGTMALVPQVVDAVGKVPVVAAGGISDGRGIAAALALGASGVQMGTRFLVAKESGAFPAYKTRLLAAKETDTTVTRVFTGRPARSIVNKFIKEFEGIDPLPWPLQGLIADDIFKNAWLKDNADFFPILAGQGLRLLKEQTRAKDIVEELVSQTIESIDTLKMLQK
jgi:nitronate monooxygenase